MDKYFSRVKSVKYNQNCRLYCSSTRPTLQLVFSTRFGHYNIIVLTIIIRDKSKTSCTLAFPTLIIITDGKLIIFRIACPQILTEGNSFITGLATCRVQPNFICEQVLLNCQLADLILD